MNRVYGAGEAVVAHLGDLADLRLGEARVGSHYPECGALPPTQACSGLREQLHRVAKRAILQPWTRKHLPGPRVPDLTEGVHGGKGTDDKPASEVGRGAPEAAFHRVVHAEHLPYCRPCACSYASLSEV